MSEFEDSGWSDADYAEHYREAADGFIVERTTLLRLVCSFHREMVGAGHGSRVLDMGCGDGTLARVLLDCDASIELMLQDGSADMLGAARERFDAEACVSFHCTTFDDIAIVRTAFEWVRDRIPHTADVGGEVVTCSASEVMRAGTGICYAKAHLLAALLRANGIAAGFCYQVLRRDAPLSGVVLHGLNAVCLSALGRWVRLDARGNTGDIDARFDLERERLAFPPDVAAGEFTYDTIYAAPARVVVETLRSGTSLAALWPRLPASLPV